MLIDVDDLRAVANRWVFAVGLAVVIGQKEGEDTTACRVLPTSETEERMRNEFVEADGPEEGFETAALDTFALTRKFPESGGLSAFWTNGELGGDEGDDVI